MKILFIIILENYKFIKIFSDSITPLVAHQVKARTCMKLIHDNIHHVTTFILVR